MRRVLFLMAGVAIVAAACSPDDPVTADREPLDSPPDPGAVPASDGFTDDDRDSVGASTVRVSGVACGRLSEGSGFAVTDQLVATNAHVVVGLTQPTIETIDGKTLDGEVVAFDAIDDLALIRVPEARFAPLALGTARDGAFGAVFGWDEGPVLTPTPFRVDRPVTVRIEAVASDERIERSSWLVAAGIEPGDSGAALVTPDGTVIGVAYATTRSTTNAGYAVRAERLEALIASGFNPNLKLPSC